MKSINFLAVISIIIITLSSSFHYPQGGFKSITLQARISTSTELLKQSSQIISDRLKVYGLKSYELSLIGEKGQIKVQLPDTIDLAEIEGLLTSKGGLTFYEIEYLKGITDFIKNDSQTNTADARVACSTFEDTDIKTRVEEFLRIHGLQSSCKLFWGIKNNKSLTCLYALKVDKEGKPLLSRSDIETITSSRDKDNGMKIEFKFLSGAKKIWADATAVNINKPIAIVVDNRVFYTPVVRTTIENGLCEITGNMTQKDVNYFLALVNSENLPVDLKILK